MKNLMNFVDFYDLQQLTIGFLGRNNIHNRSALSLNWQLKLVSIVVY